MAVEVSRSVPATRRVKPQLALVSEAERRRAFRIAKRHSLLVRLLKVTLPVVAVLASGALFLSPTMLLHMAAPNLKGSIGAVELTTDELRMVNPRFDGDTADKAHYVVTAKAAVQSLRATDVMQLETVHGHIVQLDQSWTDLTSKAGTYWTKTKAMRLTQGIVITTNADMRVELDHADIDIDKKVVTSDSAVLMTMPNGKLRGTGLLIENEQRRMLLRDAVSAHLVPPKSSLDKPAGGTRETAGPVGVLAVAPAMSDAPVDITSTRLEVLDNAKSATFSGAVEAVQAGMTIRSETMIVGYAGAPVAGGVAKVAAPSGNSAAQNVNYVTATDHVVITTADGRKVTCEQSRYDRKADTMTLQGNVVLDQKGSELHADMLVYDMGAKTTHVTAKNRVSGHFEQDAMAAAGAKLIPASAPAAPAGLGSLSATQAATDISAEKLDIDNAANTAEFAGTVVVSQRGNRLTGDRLHIDMGTRHMTMSGPGRVAGRFDATAQPATHGGKTAKAASPDAAADQTGLGQSFASLAASSDAPTNIEADNLAVEDERGLATFTGSVVVVRGGNRITAGSLAVDYGGGAANQGRGQTQLVSIHAKQHVVIHTPDNQSASGDVLFYDPRSNQLTMTGNVTIAQAGNVVQGDRLIVDLATGESHLESHTVQAEATQLGVAKPVGGRASMLIIPNSMPQFGAGAHSTTARRATTPPAAPKQSLSGSDVMVGPEEPQ